VEQPVKRPTLVAVILAAALLLGLVALASRPEGSGAAGLETPAMVSRVLLDSLFYLSLLLVVLFLGLCIWALWPDPEAPELPRPQRRSWLWLLVPVLTAGVAALTLSRLRLGALQAGLPGGGGGGGQNGIRTGPANGGFTGLDWIALAIVALLVATTAVIAYRRLRGGARSNRRDWKLAAALEEVFDDAVDDVLAEADPRRAVIAAYARMERVLASAGLPRRDPEAPLEYVARARAELELPDAMTRLADLYEWARFSQHEVMAHMREEALSALVAIRDQLRELRAAREKPLAV
jgi:hypothetical protein